MVRQHGPEMISFVPARVVGTGAPLVGGAVDGRSILPFDAAGYGAAVISW